MVTKRVMHKKKLKSLMSDNDNKDSSVVEQKGKKCSISKLGSKVDIYAATTRAIDEYVGKEFGHEMRVQVLYDKGATVFLLQREGHKASECEKKKKEDEVTVERDSMQMQQQLLWMA
jgi:hypothetical protein